MNEHDRGCAIWRSIRVLALLMLAGALAGCAASSLSLAPEAPDVPYKPETSVSGAEADPSAASKLTATGARDFGLAPLPDLQFDTGPGDLESSHVYSLAELIDLAQTSNPETRVAWERARQAALAVGVVKAFYLPMLSATAIGGYQHTSGSNEAAGVLSNPGSLNSNGTVTGVGLQWLLFDFGQRDAFKEAAVNLSWASNIGFNGAHQKIIFDVSRSFYDYTSARQRVAIAEKTRDASARLLDAASEKFKNGVGTAVETAQARQLLAQANFNLVQSRGAERDIYHGLIASVGISPAANIRVADVSGRPLSPAAMVPVDRLIAAAIARRADIQASYAAAKAAHAGIAAAEAEFMPKVFLSASGTYVTGGLNVTSMPTLNLGALGSPSLPVATSSSLSATNGTVLGGVTVPIFDGGIRDARLREAQSRTDAAEATLQRLQQNAASEIVTADDALRSSLAAYQAAISLVSASRTTEDAAFAAYKSGAGAITTAIEAEKALLAARLAQEPAHGSALIAAAALAFATGKLSSSDAVDAGPLR
ncbi:TolC family protein [Rhodoblastus sp.]|uniref:TolC family protein n=1 Tax=Rhodoblastus sp. TaxID=1962975 RepID=UPI003F98C14F